MKTWLGIILGILTISSFISSSVFAGQSENFEVKVSIAATASVSLSGGQIDFGTKGVSSELTSTTPIIVTNNGSGSPQTYSLSITNPADWTAVTAVPGFNEYRISAAFNSDENVSWSPANHAVTTASVAATETKFTGNQTGKGVAYGSTRKLYVKLETPSATDSPGAKTIPVIITAAVD